MNLDSYKLWTALVTPFDEHQEIDFISLENLLRRQEAVNNGVLLLGSTGEALALDQKEKSEILHLATSLHLNIPLMVGVGGIHLQQTKEWISYLNSLPLDAYLLVTPLYAKPGRKGQINWFAALLDAATKPCMLYNIPSRTGVALDKEALSALEQHPNFWAIKEASGTKNTFAEYANARSKVQVFSGNDELFPDLAQQHCAGLVSVMSNAWPRETRKLVDLVLSGEKMLTAPWKEIAASLLIAANPVPIKGLLYALEQIATPLVRPPLSHEDLPSKQGLIRAHEMLKTWKQNHL